MDEQNDKDLTAV